MFSLESVQGSLFAQPNNLIKNPVFANITFTLRIGLLLFLKRSLIMFTSFTFIKFVIHFFDFLLLIKCSEIFLVPAPGSQAKIIGIMCTDLLLSIQIIYLRKLSSDYIIFNTKFTADMFCSKIICVFDNISLTFKLQADYVEMQQNLNPLEISIILVLNLKGLNFLNSFYFRAKLNLIDKQGKRWICDIKPLSYSL